MKFSDGGKIRKNRAKIDIKQIKMNALKSKYNIIYFKACAKCDCGN